MELVEGERLDRWLESHELSMNERLDLFIRICQAVQHAHSRVVIHRDIKPSNILVRESDGAPKLLDFGVARLIEPDGEARTLMTGRGEVVGTLAYMSPEQLSGDPGAVDTRSDVYALGVILFSMLSGALPLEVSSLSVAAAARRIEQESPRRLGEVLPGAPRDLDTIVAHALEKDARRRYQTAETLMEDVRRFLGNLPINARPPTTLYVLGRMARRHRVGVGAGAGVAVVVVGLTIFAISSAFTANRALAQAKRAQTRAETINRFFMDDLFTSAHSMSLGAQTRVTDMIDFGLPRIDQRFGDDALGQAGVRMSMSTMLIEVGRPLEAVEQLEIAMERLGKAGLEGTREYVRLMRSLAAAHALSGRGDVAEGILRDAVERAKAQGMRPDDSDRLQLEGSLAACIQNQGRWQEAEPLLQDVLDRVKAKGEHHLKDVVELYTQLIQIARLKGDTQGRIRLIDEMLVYAADASDPSTRTMAAVFEAERCVLVGDAEGALAARLRAAGIAREHIEPASLPYRVAMAEAATSLANAGRFEEAREYALATMASIETAMGEYHYEAERYAFFLYQICERADMLAEAARWYDRNRLLRFHVAGPGEMPSLLSTIEDALEFYGGKPAALDRLVEHAGTLTDTNPPHTAFLANAGRLLAHEGDPRGADLLARAFRAYDPANDEQRPADLLERLDLSLPAYYEAQGQPEEAERWRARLAEARPKL
jgi:hypothetical protein